MCACATEPAADAGQPDVELQLGQEVFHALKAKGRNHRDFLALWRDPIASDGLAPPDPQPSAERLSATRRYLRNERIGHVRASMKNSRGTAAALMLSQYSASDAEGKKTGRIARRDFRE